MLRAGDELALTIEKPVAGGRMLARHDGQVVLVAGAIPGEEVAARIERVTSGVAYAAVARVVAPHPDRRDASDPACGGNVYAHIAYDRQLRLKSEIVADAFRRIARLPLDAGGRAVGVAASPERGYRMRARLHVRGRRAGFFREGTHELCDAARTGQLLDASVAAVGDLAGALARAGIHEVEALEVTENIAADERAVHIGLAPHARPSRDRLAALGPVEGVTGLTCGGAGRAPFTVSGSAYVADPISAIVEGVTASDARLRRHPASFFQGNRYLLSALAGAVVDRVLEGPVLDLYAGVGLFATAAAARGRGPVTAVEGDRASAADLRANAGAVGVSVVESAVETFLGQASGEPPATVIVDPPRAGLAPEVVKRLVEGGRRRVIYVSCDVATLARDARRLVDGGYRLCDIEAFDLFPNTAHVETLATFET